MLNLLNSSFKCSYDELITYYPLFYRNVREMDEILKAQGRLADGLENGIEQIFSDCFIDTADKSVITQFEKMIGINGDGKSLEERRSLVKSHLVGTGKISASLIREMVRAYTGAGSECSFKNSRLSVSVERGVKDTISFESLSELLSAKLPAHIAFDLSLECRKEIVLSYSRAVHASDFPECGLYYCGQEVML